ncbi:MAG: hypothetical protein AAFX93_13980 [Verrucomicrobiota bacterium]
MRFCFPALAVVLLFAGCAESTFTAYKGAQVDWPTSPGAFIDESCSLPIYREGYPDRAYEVLGTVSTKTAPVRRSETLCLAAEKAKEMGADAVLFLDESKEYVGTTGGGNFYNYGGSVTGYTDHGTALYAGRAAVYAIKFIDSPKPATPQNRFGGIPVDENQPTRQEYLQAAAIWRAEARAKADQGDYQAAADLQTRAEQAEAAAGGVN